MKQPKKDKEEIPKNLGEFIDFLKKKSQTSEFKYLIDELIKSARGSTNNLTWSVIFQIIREVDAGRLSWGYHKELLCGIFFILGKIGDRKSYRTVIGYAKSLDKSIPLGAIKFLASLLTGFKELDIVEIFELAESRNQIQSAFGVVSLSTLLIENKLDKDQVDRLESILKRYLNSVYFMDNYIESILSHIEAVKDGGLNMSVDDLDLLLDDSSF